jgi:membrane protease YdiL (CAAX protease family)
LWTAIVFGLFHLPNLIVGVGATQFFQVLLAAASGATLYVFRRYRGLILIAMIAHGIWDMSAFLAVTNGREWLTIAGVALALVSLILGILVLISIWRTDRSTLVTPAGIEHKQ